MRPELQRGFVEEVELRLIKPSPHPLRAEVGPVTELASSIAEKGLLEPILIRPMGEAFEVVAGNRRLKACRSLGMRKVLCDIVYFVDKVAYETALVENLQQRTMNAIDEARALRKYVED